MTKGQTITLLETLDIIPESVRSEAIRHGILPPPPGAKLVRETRSGRQITSRTYQLIPPIPVPTGPISAIRGVEIRRGPENYVATGVGTNIILAAGADFSDCLQKMNRTVIQEEQDNDNQTKAA
jgi:hypothetical protein